MPTVINGRQLGIPRREETYRWYRRKYSILNRDKKNWIGVEAKPPKEHPPLVLKIAGENAKHPGETHYVPLWPKDKQGTPSKNYLSLR
jgi:hypothetical protein